MSSLRTLVFCTSYVEDMEVWENRHYRWVKALNESHLKFDQALIFDDGSPAMPNAALGFQVMNEGDVMSSAQKTVLWHFSERLGRESLLNFPGWWRSFAAAAQWAQQNNFEKIIHLESDAFLISPRIINYMNDVDNSWVTMYSPRYSFPEIAIQAMAGEGLKKYIDFSKNDYDVLRGKVHENIIPVSQVNKNFVGDHYGEGHIPIPLGADWSTQTICDAHKDYYWWLSEDAAIFPFFGRQARSDLLVQGWANPEMSFTWSVGSIAKLRLPTTHLVAGGDALLGLFLEPIRDVRIKPKQVIDVRCNDRFLGCFSIRDKSLVELVLPGRLVCENEFLDVEIHVHTPCRPCDISTSTDSRLLGVALRYAKLGKT